MVVRRRGRGRRRRNEVISWGLSWIRACISAENEEQSRDHAYQTWQENVIELGKHSPSCSRLPIAQLFFQKS